MQNCDSKANTEAILLPIEGLCTYSSKNKLHSGISYRKKTSGQELKQLVSFKSSSA